VYAYSEELGDPACEDAFTAAGLVPTAEGAARLSTVLDVSFRREGYRVDPAELAAAGVPLNGTQAVLSCILASLPPPALGGSC
jgi:hypothetical protein